MAPEYGPPYEPRPYHGQYFLLGEVPSLVAQYGLPPDGPDEDYSCFTTRSFESCVEVRLWTDEPLVAAGLLSR